MRIFDKAAWQIDNGVPYEIVEEHFSLVFNWLNEQGLLSADGKEILDIGIDESVSLSDSLVTEDGAKFLEMFYEAMITQSSYDVSTEKQLLPEMYTKYKQGIN